MAFGTIPGTPPLSRSMPGNAGREAAAARDAGRRVQGRPRRHDGRPVSITESLLVDVLPALHERHGLGVRPAGGGEPASRGRGRGEGGGARGPARTITAANDRGNGRVGDPGDDRRAAPPRASADREPVAGDWPHDEAAFDTALCAGNADPWDREVATLERAMRAGELCRRTLRERVVAPAAMRLGAAWATDGASLVDVTIGTARLMEALARLPRAPRDGTGARVVLAPIPGDGHVLGLCLLAEVLREGGFAVEVMARPSAAAVGRAVGGRADVLGIGVPVARHAGRAAMLVRAVRAATRGGPMPLVIAGGGAARECAALLGSAGVDEVLTGATDVAGWLTEKLEERVVAPNAGAAS